MGNVVSLLPVCLVLQFSSYNGTFLSGVLTDIVLKVRGDY